MPREGGGTLSLLSNNSGVPACFYFYQRRTFSRAIALNTWRSAAIVGSANETPVAENPGKLTSLHRSPFATCCPRQSPRLIVIYGLAIDGGPFSS